MRVRINGGGTLNILQLRLDGDGAMPYLTLGYGGLVANQELIAGRPDFLREGVG